MTSARPWTRAHHRFLDQGEVERAARCAGWLAFPLLKRAELARSRRPTRARRLVGTDHPGPGHAW